MLHQLLLASYSQPEAAGFILRASKEFSSPSAASSRRSCARSRSNQGRNHSAGASSVCFRILTLIGWL